MVEFFLRKKSIDTSTSEITEPLQSHSHTHPCHQDHDFSKPFDLSLEDDDGDVRLPQTCDVKEALILKLQELDKKVYMLLKSNKSIEKEMKGTDPDWYQYISENADLILRTKDEIARIIRAFLKVGVDLDKEVYGVLEHRVLWDNSLEPAHAKKENP